MYHIEFNGFYININSSYPYYYILFIFVYIQLSICSSSYIHQINEAVFINPQTNSASVRCPLDIKHDYKIQWYDVINKRYELDHHQGYYHINGLEPYDRELICSSISQTGIEENDKYRIKIRIYDRPLPIRNVYLTQATNTSLTIQWKHENYNRNANITYYQLVLKHNYTMKNYILVNHTQSIYTFTSLNPNTYYSIEISAIDVWQRSSQKIRISGRTLRKNESISSHRIIDRHLLHQSISCYQLNHQLLLIEFNRSRFLMRNPIYNLTIYNNQDHIVLTDNLQSSEQRLILTKTFYSFLYRLKDNSSKYKIKLTISTMQLEFLGWIHKHCEDFYPVYSPLTCSIKSLNRKDYQLMINTQLHHDHKHIITLKPNDVFYKTNDVQFTKENIHHIDKYIIMNISDVVKENYTIIVEHNLIGSDKYEKLNISILCSINRIASFNRTSKISTGFIIILILLIVLFVVIATFIIYRKGLILHCRRRVIHHAIEHRKSENRHSCFVQSNDSMVENVGNATNINYQEYGLKPIPLDLFPAYVAYMHKDSDFGFLRLFETICDSSKTHKISADISQKEFNQCKNRYVNILTYDHSRVKLSGGDKDGKENYINANYIDGFGKKNAYIATQGPMMNTINDFWRMIWEKDVSVLVMITNIKECGRIKCDIYWPKDGTRIYGAIQVTLVSTLCLAYYIKRVFLIRYETNDKLIDSERLVHQFHFTNWPDHGVPMFALPVLSFIRRSSACNAENGGPIVVHCSAGVGRTGAYIVIDTMLKRIAQNQAIEICSFLKHIRRQRNFLVQTEEQFIFIYDVLCEAVTLSKICFHNLELNEHNIDNIMCTLDSFDKDSNLTQIEKQFQSIKDQIKTDSQTLSVGQMTENSAKNKSQIILPLNACRVILCANRRLIPGDYINASYIHGFYRIDEFIITQHPMMHTKGDFWQMIWENNVNVIVSLYADEKSQADVPDFWPIGSQILNCGKFIVTGNDENFEYDYIYRDLILRAVEGSRELQVKLISCSYWPDTCSPVKASFDVINKIRNLKTNQPIVVHDLFGGHRAATFCALYTMSEQIEVEGVINLYELARFYYLKRPGIWRYHDDLVFLYRCAKVLLDEYKSSHCNRDSSCTFPL